MDRPAPTQQRILVADDVSDMRDLYMEFLTLHGFQVTAAADGKEALSLAFATQPAAIVMDVEMPAMDGLSATRALKHDERTRHTPIIVLTGTSLPDRLAEVRRAGCDAVLRKPCMPEVLLAAVRHVLRGEPIPAYLSPP